MSSLRILHISDHVAQFIMSVLISSHILRRAGGFHSPLVTHWLLSLEDCRILCLSLLKTVQVFLAKNAKAERSNLYSENAEFWVTLYHINWRRGSWERGDREKKS